MTLGLVFLNLLSSHFHTPLFPEKTSAERKRERGRESGRKRKRRRRRR